MSSTAQTVQDNLCLPDRPTLSDYQVYVDQMVKSRGFDQETIPQIFMLLLEECGEMAKAARKFAQIKSDSTSQKFDIECEVADVFIYILDICNHLGVDLESAFRKKEDLNKARQWK